MRSIVPKSGAPRHIGWLVAALSAVAGSSAHAADPAWQADVYYIVGSIVQYNGRSYAALVSQVDYLDTGWNPTVATLWKELGAGSGGDSRSSSVGAFSSGLFARSAETAGSRCALEWNAANIYTAGGVASRNGVNYKANWWTQGEDPASHSVGTSGQPWSVAGSCSGGSKTADDSKASAPADTVEKSDTPGTRDARTVASHHAG